MGFVRDLFGGGGSDAAGEAAAIQAESGREALGEQRAALETVRADLQPFRAAGERQLAPVESELGGLSSLITDPNRQRQFVESSPFFGALADDAQRRIFSNQAARGKVGSGETAKALQNALLLTGNQLVGQNIAQRQNLIGLRQNVAASGANAAAGQASATQGITGNISDLITGVGNVRGAGVVGAANARSQGAANLANLGLGIGSLILSDVRAKTSIKRIGKTDDGIGIYRYRYRGGTMPHIGVLAQEVEKVKPEAVVTTIEGVKGVDYERVS